jgi:predicted DNA-binding protein (UPF0278 family)
MATTKPRVSVTLDPEMYEEVRELAVLTGESMSAVIGGLLDAVAPTVHRVVEAGRLFQSYSAEMQDRVGGTFAAAEAKIAPALHRLQEQAFAALRELEGEPDDPRPVTRGSRPPLVSVHPEKSGPAR